MSLDQLQLDWWQQGAEPAAAAAAAVAADSAGPRSGARGRACSDWPSLQYMSVLSVARGCQCFVCSNSLTGQCATGRRVIITEGSFVRSVGSRNTATFRRSSSRGRLLVYPTLHYYDLAALAVHLALDVNDVWLPIHAGCARKKYPSKDFGNIPQRLEIFK